MGVMRCLCFFCGRLFGTYTIQETDPVDVRAYLHRDGSVIMQISVEDLQNPQALYQAVSGYSHLTSVC